jgi:hypothetical protein
MAGCYPRRPRYNAGVKNLTSAVLVGIALSVVPAIGFAAERAPLPVCAVNEPDPALLKSVESALKALRIDAAEVQTVRIPVAYHVITAGAEGRIPSATIKKLLKSLNWGFRGTPFTFVLDRVTRTNNPKWYNDCGPESGNQEGMKKKLARDPARILNIYSCKPYDPSRASYVLGFGSFPFSYPEDSFMQGIVLRPLPHLRRQLRRQRRLRGGHAASVRLTGADLPGGDRHLPRSAGDR